MAPLVRRSWAPRGQTPVLLQRARSHQKVSAITALAVSPRGRRIRLFFRLHPGVAITAPLVRNFLHQLSRHLRGRCIIVWDRLNTHRGHVVAGTLANIPRFHVEYFPPYAPELNPVEYVWGYLKTSPMANRPELDLEALTRSAHRHSKRLKHRRSLLQSFLYHSSLFCPT